MALGPGIDSEPSEPSPSDYRMGVPDLIAKTFGFYGRRFPMYLIMIGLISAVLVVVPLGLLWLFFGEEALTLASYVGTTPSSFINGMSSLALLLSNPVPGFEIDFTGDPFALLGVGLAISVIGMVVIAFFSGVSIKYTHEDYGRKPIKMSEAFSFAGSRFGSLLVTSLIFELLIIAVGLPGVVLLLMSTTTTDITILVGGTFAYLGGTIFTLFLQIRLYPASAVVIAEGKSSFAALKRAFELTSGEFWHVFGGQILLSLITLMFTLFLPSLFDFFFLEAISDLIVSIISALLFSALSFIYQAVLYRDLNARKAVVKQEWW